MGQFLLGEAIRTMTTDNQPYFQAPAGSPDKLTPSRAALWAGRALTALAVSFLTFDAGIKLLELAPAVQGTLQLGYPASMVFGLGLVELMCLALYLVPRTAVLGALLWTGYLGGAVATHVRLQNPLFSHVLSPVYVAILIWAGVCLRRPRLRALLMPGDMP